VSCRREFRSSDVQLRNNLSSTQNIDVRVGTADSCDARCSDDFMTAHLQLYYGRYACVFAIREKSISPAFASLTLSRIASLSEKQRSTRFVGVDGGRHYGPQIVVMRCLAITYPLFNTYRTIAACSGAGNHPLSHHGRAKQSMRTPR